MNERIKFNELDQWTLELFFKEISLEKECFFFRFFFERQLLKGAELSCSNYMLIYQQSIDQIISIIIYRILFGYHIGSTYVGYTQNRKWRAINLLKQIYSKCLNKEDGCTQSQIRITKIIKATNSVDGRLLRAVLTRTFQLMFNKHTHNVIIHLCESLKSSYQSTSLYYRQTNLQICVYAYYKQYTRLVYATCITVVYHTSTLLNDFFTLF